MNVAKRDGKSSIADKFKAIAWGLKLAWSIDKKMLILWGGLSILLAVLPAISLIYNRQVLAVLSGFLAGQPYGYADVVTSIIGLGLVLTFVGLSSRLNKELIYMMMFDKYYYGIMRIMSQAVHWIRLEDLLKKEINDEYNYVITRAGSLTDLASGLCDITGKAVSVISILIVAFTASKLVFVISLAYIAGVFVLNFILTDRARENTMALRHEIRKAVYYEDLPENENVAKEIRVFGSVDHVVKQWEKHYMKVQKSDEERVFAKGFGQFISGIAFYLFLVIIVVVSIFGVANGSMPPDVLLIIFTLCISIFNISSGLAKGIHAFDSGLFGLERQMNFLSSAPIQRAEEEAYKADIAVENETVYKARNLVFKYDGNKAAVDGVSFEIKKGEVVALVGQNGSGKTTLTKLLADMFSPTSGSLEFFGRPMQEYRSDFARLMTSVFFQDYFLFHLTLRENIGFGNVGEVENIEQILKAAEKGGLNRMLSTLPLGLDTIVNKRIDTSGRNFSGGEKQRIASARTHMSDKDVLIFDEPAAMLDPIAEIEQFTNIQKTLDGRTAILISHRIGFARLASKIIMMDSGKIVECGTHDELMALDGAYATMFRQQAQWYDTSVRREEALEL